MSKAKKSSFVFLDEWLRDLDRMSPEECQSVMSALLKFRTGMPVPKFEDRYLDRVVSEAILSITESENHKQDVSIARREAKLKSISDSKTEILERPTQPVIAEEQPVILEADIIEQPEEAPKKKRKIFVKPSQDDVINYFYKTWDVQNNIEPVKFYDHFESNGWMVGKNKMVDWHAAARTWMTNVKNNRYGSSTKFERQSATEQQLGFAIASQCATQLQQESRGGSSGEFIPPAL